MILTLILISAISLTVLKKKIAGTDFKYQIRESEWGHAFSYLWNLNDFQFDIEENQIDSCTVYWNEYVIYKKGKTDKKNLEKARYIYGDNFFKIITDRTSKEFCFYKFNNWDYNKFAISVRGDEITFHIDGVSQ